MGLAWRPGGYRLVGLWQWIILSTCSECIGSGGEALGSCAQGFGTCCYCEYAAIREHHLCTHMQLSYEHVVEQWRRTRHTYRTQATQRPTPSLRTPPAPTPSARSPPVSARYRFKSLLHFNFFYFQIRLDFEQFEMGPPISNNVVSYFYVSLQPPCYRIFLILYHNTGSAIIIICCIKRCVDTGTVTDYVSLVHSAGTTTRTEPTHLCGYNTGYHGM